MGKRIGVFGTVFALVALLVGAVSPAFGTASDGSAAAPSGDGHGHTIRQTCFEKRVLRQDGTGYLSVHDIALSRGGSDGPGAAITSRGEISLADCEITQNLAEEPGGGVF